MSEKIINHVDFIKMLVSNFPEIEEEVLDEDYEGLISLQIEPFRKLTQNAIEKGDNVTIEKCLMFINSVINRSEHKVENSLYISFLQKLDFSACPTAKKILLPEVQNNLKAINHYQQIAHEDTKLKGFLDSL